MLSDEQIWGNLKAGEKNALEVLFYRHHKDLYRYAVKFCGDRQMAEDHIQNLFLRIWERKDHLGRVKAVKTYLWTALRRSLLTTLKRKDKRRQKAQDKLSEDLFFISAEEFIIKEEQKELQKRELEKAIEVLSPKQREILYLRFYEGMSYQEIEEIMSINYQVARNYLHKCLQKLRETLSPESTVLLSFLLCSLCFM